MFSERVSLESEAEGSRVPKVLASSGCWGLKSTKVKIKKTSRDK